MDEITEDLLFGFIMDIQARIVEDEKKCHTWFISSKKSFKYQNVVVDITVKNSKYLLNEQNRVIKKANKILEESSKDLDNATTEANWLKREFPELGD